MIILRKKTKTFAQDDGYAGLKGRIINKPIRAKGSFTPSPTGPWAIKIGTEAEIQMGDSKYYSDNEMRRIDKIIEHIKRNPYDIKNFGIHPLWDYTDSKVEEGQNPIFSIWSAKITQKDRLVYVVFKDRNEIRIINAKDHVIIEEPYGQPKTHK